MIIESYLGSHTKDRPGIYQFHLDNLSWFNEAKGSTKNHQAWPGGLRDHLSQCFIIAADLYRWMFLYRRARAFSLDSVIAVLYFHDVEKIWKHSTLGLPAWFDKSIFYTTYLPVQYKVVFTEEELNALKYIHGEGDEYRTDQRVMNRLAGFCHAVDVLSARVLHDLNWHGELHESANGTEERPAAIGEGGSQCSPGQLDTVLDHGDVRSSSVGEGGPG